MNIKTIVLGSLALGLVVGSSILMNSKQEKSVYIPQLNSAVYGQAGYAEYMHMLRADPATGLIDPALVNKVRNEVMARSKMHSKSSLGLNWVQQGPDNVGGRTRAILVDKDNSNIVYAGSVTGGLFVSTDATSTWTPVSGMQGLLGKNLAISCITQTDNGRIFFGTGSSFEGAFGNGSSGAIGNGVYEYVPSSGAVVPVVTNVLAAPNNNSGSFWSFTNAIAAHGNKLFLGTRDGMVWANMDGSGNYPTSFAGWTNPIEVIAGVPETGTVQDIDIASDGSILVSFGGKAYVSDQSDVTFTKIPNTQLSGGSRWSGAIAPSNSSVMYMLRSNNTISGLSISEDKGQTWTEIVPSGVSTGTPTSKDPFVQNDGTGGQGGYDDAIAVNPGDWGHVIVGGVQLYEWKHAVGSSPIGGDWNKSATLFEAAQNQNYVHADKHTIVFADANTVYIGGDGGVAKSTNNGMTWDSRNFGYNVTTFYDMALASNGWILGGAQDNGSQLVTFGSFGVNTPLGAVEIQGGDGFDCGFSRIGNGVAYATSQNGSLSRFAGGGAGGSFYDGFLANLVATVGQPFHTVIEDWDNPRDQTSIDSVNLVIGPLGTIVKPAQFDANGDVSVHADTVFPGDVIPTGDTIYYTSATNGILVPYIVPSTIVIGTPNDTLRFIDPIQTRFVTRTSAGIYLTRDAARLNATAIKWYKIAPQSNVENFEFSADGNHLFMGTSSGQVIRVSGLSLVNNDFTQTGWDTTLTVTTIGAGMGGVVGLACDPNNINNLIATSGGYTNGNHVYRTKVAVAATSSTGTFNAIQGAGGTSLPKMPVYDAEIDYTDNNKVMIATEWGVWTCDNAFSSASGGLVQWTDESNAPMAHVPVFAIEQQSVASWESSNSGVVYLGTHGRGFYKASELEIVSVEENDFDDFADNGFVTDLNVYPNPMNNSGTLAFDLKENVEATIKIYNLTGSLVKTIDLGVKTQGEHAINFDASSLSVGSYIISLESGNERKVAKFIVTR